VPVAASAGECRRYLFTAEPQLPRPPAPAAGAQSSPRTGRPVHLTFDDGYVDLCLTVDLVNGLGVHATFFLTGQAIITYPDCVRRLVAAGNQLGNHTWAHENLTRLSRQQILTSLQRTEDAARSVAGVSTRPLCRPPYGAINAAVRQVAAEWGCQMILWDRDTRDWTGLPAATITNTSLSVSCNGEVILMHTRAYPQSASPCRWSSLRCAHAAANRCYSSPVGIESGPELSSSPDRGG
jgi:peptidoglycan-N-acetylglucosamine deacetylase